MEGTGGEARAERTAGEPIRWTQALTEETVRERDQHPRAAGCPGRHNCGDRPEDGVPSGGRTTSGVGYNNELRRGYRTSSLGGPAHRRGP